MRTWQDPNIAVQTVVEASLGFQVVQGLLKENITVYQASKGESFTWFGREHTVLAVTI